MKKTAATFGILLVFAALTACGNGDGANDGSTNGDDIDGSRVGTGVTTNGSHESDNMDYTTDTIDTDDDMNETP